MACNKITLVSDIVNDDYTQFLYDHFDIQDKERTTTQVPYPSKEDIDQMNSFDWNIFLICGRSGSGKSTVLRMLGEVKPIEYDYTKAVISQFQEWDVDKVCDLLSGVGLSSVPAWLRKPQELSNGELARLDACKRIYDARNEGVILCDEWTSLVNRSCAKSMSWSFQRYLRNNGLKAIIASCHYDTLEWLKPDFLWNLNKKDIDGNVELERMVYADDKEYSMYQSVDDKDILTKAYQIQ